MNLTVDHPWVLFALLLCLLPLFNNGVSQSGYPSVQLLPADLLSDFLSALIKLIAIAAITCLVLALAGLNRGKQSRERIGYGAHIVLLLDSACTK